MKDNFNLDDSSSVDNLRIRDNNKTQNLASVQLEELNESRNKP